MIIRTFGSVIPPQAIFVSPESERAAPLVGKGGRDKPRACVHRRMRPIAQRDARNPVLFKSIVMRHGTTAQYGARADRHAFGYQVSFSRHHEPRRPSFLAAANATEASPRVAHLLDGVILQGYSVTS
jgi:hypothetical protein